MAQHLDSRRKIRFVLVVISIFLLIVLWNNNHKQKSFSTEKQTHLEKLGMSPDGMIHEPEKELSVEEIHMYGIHHRGVWIFVLNKNNDVLFLKRSPTTKTCPDTWTAPGEHCKPNEPYYNSVVRGLKEELNITPQDTESIIQVSEYPELIHLEYINNSRIEYQWTHLFLVTINTTSLSLEADENTASKWISIQETNHWLQNCHNEVNCFFCEVKTVWVEYHDGLKMLFDRFNDLMVYNVDRIKKIKFPKPKV
eukprot:gene3124-6144_t